MFASQALLDVFYQPMFASFVTEYRNNMLLRFPSHTPHVKIELAGNPALSKQTAVLVTNVIQIVIHERSVLKPYVIRDKYKYVWYCKKIY